MIDRPLRRPADDRGVGRTTLVAALVVLIVAAGGVALAVSRHDDGKATSTTTSSSTAGSAAAAPSTNGPLILAASNTTPVFTAITPDLVKQHDPVRFTFGASSMLAVLANTPSNPAVLFASADEANVNKVIASTDHVAGSPGTCATDCTGIGATKVQYTVGRLVVFSCTSGGRTLAPAQGAPSCAAPAGGYLAHPPKTPADVVALLKGNASIKLTIADPGTLPPGAAPPTAPYGLAAYQALTSTAVGGGGLTAAQFDAMVASGQIIKGANVTATQANVTTGAAQIAMLPRSFVVSPHGNDTDSWTTVAAGLHKPIAQWAVILDKPADATYAADKAIAQAFLKYLLSSKGQAALASFGYEPLP